MRNIQIVPLCKMEEMRVCLNEYLTELSEFDPDIDFDEKGQPIYNWFDCYWDDKDRFPIYLLIDGKVAGIAMIRELDNKVYNFAEFYVRPQYRVDGNSMWFAKAVTDLFEGQFEFATRFTNPRALKFWGKFANTFEKTEYEDDEIWRNWVIRRNDFKEHSLNLHPTYYELIKNKEKVFEGRLNTEAKRKFQIGDKIRFYKEPEKVETMTALIMDKYEFNDFEEMAESLDKGKLGFANSTKEEMVKVYRTIYKEEDEKENGVVVFKIRLI